MKLDAILRDQRNQWALLERPSATLGELIAVALAARSLGYVGVAVGAGVVMVNRHSLLAGGAS